MVLARKKLKQKLHKLPPGGVADAEGEGEAEVEEGSMKEDGLVSSKSKRPRQKRPKKLTPLKEPLHRRKWQSEEQFRREVELRREERRKVKKEKRRIRRLMEAEAAEGKVKLEPEGEAAEEDQEHKSEAEGEEKAAEEQVPEPKDKAAKVKNHKVEKRKSNSKDPKDGDKVKNQKPLQVADLAVGSDDPIVAEESEKNAKKVYVGGIPYYSSEDDIRSFFEACGSITAVDCMTFPEGGKFRGIAILTFKTDAAAQRALVLDGADMGGFYLKIQPYKANREKEDFAPKMIEGYNRVYVGNLAWDITEDDLKKFFSDCKISSIRFGTDKETGDFKGYAHVDFSEGTSLVVAMKLDQKVIKGRPVRIRCAVPKKDNQKFNGNANPDSSKNKIRTCYECGTPGHISSSCPNKKASEAISDEKKANIDSATTSSKKRRTCYECGVPGHLSSACPNKKAGDAVSSDHGPDDETKPVPSITPEENKIADESNSAPSRRRKCYECGIPGHLSSACPNKVAIVNSDMEKPYDGSSAKPSATSDGNKASGDTNSVPAKKKKRRTCYECGIAGHLSSECPNKTT
ncbi:hypothetical protein E2562_008414 [Oryza meyeriana var. granulata]|uniref:Uncharacterized protein n=1 Tax=Oryza meyeriana var. granulata TaxID=110450 RepID=A0A6G1EH58_9ORYZ|nr:hypothetical protein E2562_008414 [Oryza meyeriana var. granulata]